MNLHKQSISAPDSLYFYFTTVQEVTVSQGNTRDVPLKGAAQQELGVSAGRRRGALCRDCTGENNRTTPRQHLAASEPSCRQHMQENN